MTNKEALNIIDDSQVASIYPESTLVACFDQVMEALCRLEKLEEFASLVKKAAEVDRYRKYNSSNFNVRGYFELDNITPEQLELLKEFIDVGSNESCVMI